MHPARLLHSFASSVLADHPNALDAFHRTADFFSRTTRTTTVDDFGNAVHTFAKREIEKGSGEYIAFACLIPVLVILSGIFAGLTLGYMSLDETQLNVLSLSGTPCVHRVLVFFCHLIAH